VFPNIEETRYAIIAQSIAISSIEALFLNFKNTKK